MERITMVQEWEKEDNALRALISLRLALFKYPLVLKGINIDSQTLFYLQQLQTNFILDYDYIIEDAKILSLNSMDGAFRDRKDDIQGVDIEGLVKLDGNN